MTEKQHHVLLMLECFDRWYAAASEVVDFIGACRGDRERAEAWFESRPVRPDPNSNRGWGWAMPASLNTDTAWIHRLIKNDFPALGQASESLTAILSAARRLRSTNGLNLQPAALNDLPEQRILDDHLRVVEQALGMIGDQLRRQVADEWISRSQPPAADLPTLSDKAAVVYEILLAAPPYRGLTGTQILDELGKMDIDMDQSTLTTHVLPQLDPYGLDRQRKKGYRILPSRRPLK